MLTSGKTKAKKALSGFLLLLILLQSFPGFALGYELFGYELDIHAGIRKFVSKQVETSDSIIEPNKLLIKTSVNKGTTWLGNKYRDGFSYLESKIGLDPDNNKLYKAFKNYTLHNVGFNLGLVNGAGTIASELYSFAAKLPTAPERIVNFSYNYAENPDKYHMMVSGATLAVGEALLDPWPYVNGLYQYGKSTYIEAAKDPLTLGNLHGEATALVASFVLPVGKTKPLTAVSKLEKVSKVESTGKLPHLLASLNAKAIALKNNGMIWPNGEVFGHCLRNIINPQVVCMSATPTRIGTKSITKTGTAYPLLEFSGMERTLSAAQYKLPETITQRIVSWAEHTYSGWFEKLSTADKGIIFDYTWASGKFNRLLRGKTKQTPSAEQLGNINRLSKILSTAPPLEQKIVVFRGTTDSILGKNLKGLPIEQLPGREIIDQGFLSTCLIPLPAKKLAESKLYSEKVFLIINVPPKVQGAYIGKYSANPEELEFLLNKGQRLRINKATKLDEQLVLEVDAL